MTKAFKSVGKFLLIAITFFACFGATIPVVMLMIRAFPNAPFLVQVLPFVPLMFAATRFVISPLEYHLDFKSKQYDPWYERRCKNKKWETLNCENN